jgi:hypothetical protein
VLAAGQLWEELGLHRFLADLARPASLDLEGAVSSYA